MPGEIHTTERLRGETTVSAAAVPYAFYTFSAGFTLGPSLRELHEDASMPAVIRRHGPVVGWVALLFPVVSTASAFRYEDDVPLLLPGVNPGHAALLERQRARRGWNGIKRLCWL